MGFAVPTKKFSGLSKMLLSHMELTYDHMICKHESLHERTGVQDSVTMDLSYLAQKTVRDS